MKNQKTIKLLASISALLLVSDLLLIGYSLYQHSLAESNNRVNLQPLPPAVVSVVTGYIQSREAAVGVDQATPDAWLTTVKTLTTSAWFNQLKPLDSAGDYAVAHTNAYKVNAKVTLCLWDDEAALHTASSGVVICQVSDSTLGQNGAPIPTAALIQGWKHNGQQTPAIIGLTNSNGKWLVNNDLTGQGQ